MPEKKKMGRPTDAVKCHEVKARVSEETFQHLEEYRKRNNLNQAQALRDAIHRLPKE